LRKNPWRAACHAVPDLKAILASMPVWWIENTIMGESFF
jgi:hypothetical protein